MDIKQTFNELVDVYFPELKGQGWRVRVQPNLSGKAGECRREKRMILINHTIDKDLRTLLLHELCHTKALGHGVKFITVMLRVLRTINRINCDPLPMWGKLPHKEIINRIQSQTELYNSWKEEIRCAIDVYGMRSEGVIELFHQYTLDSPESSYNNIRRSVAKESALTLKEFDKRYGKRAKEAYKEANKFMKITRKGGEPFN
ncbi:MAG: SprT family zinc-dependent metalloprotease [Deltaproteobacteria bacterium]|nr:SprT family zinc-dependent metalloprotease [Deltaproteobacteria bacterium]MBM4323936.1 SprT family zinc-dependent metalloprotease [Deltaproteobacteria bacterium]